MYLDTLENQNYTNFHIVMSDDMSTDNSAQKIIQIIERDFPRLSRRLTILRNREYIEMMGNHDIEIRNHCEKGEIVVEVDADDSLLGRQVLKVLNAYYTKNPQLWLVYASFIYEVGVDRFSKFGNNQIPEIILQNNTYRTSGRWMTSHLKTYYRDLYMKIPADYLCRKPGKYYLFAADLFSMFPMIELGSKGHVRYLNEVFYFYKMTSGCGVRFNSAAEQLARGMTPFEPLQSLDSKARLQ